MKNNAIYLLFFITLFLLITSRLTIRTQQIDQKSEESQSLADTKWTLIYDIKDIHKSYDVEFGINNVFRYSEPSDTTPDNDFWEQNGNIIFIYINNKYTVYEGRIINNELIVGTAKNITDLTWDFKLIKKS